MRGKPVHRDRTIFGLILTLAAALVVSASASPATALATPQTYTVTNPGDTGAAGDGSLRGEVAAANANPGTDTIVFAPVVSGTITFNGSGIVVKDPVDIEGPGPAQLTIRQTAAHRVFDIEALGGAPMTISGLHLADGTAPSGGAHPNIGGNVFNGGADLTLADDLITGGEAEQTGGVYSYEAPLTVRSSTISDNSAVYVAGLSVGGPGISWSVVDSTIADNLATGYVAGLGGKTYASGLIENSTISGNTAAEGTGGFELAIETGGSALVRNSTISGNTAGEKGGGLSAFLNPGATVAVEDTTIAGNVAGSLAGGIEFNGPAGALTLTDSIVAGNGAGTAGPDVDSSNGGPATTFSLIGDPSGSKLTETVPGSDLIGVASQLGPLQDNGGPTETMALLPSSPAVNKGGGPLTSDQRGDPRPVVYPGVPISAAPGANGADIGAYELQGSAPVAPPPLSPPPSPAPVKGPPRVRVACPKSAGPGGCHLKLQVFSAKLRPHHKGTRSRTAKPLAESAVATVRLGAGKSVLVPLVPKPMFAAKLEAAATLLVRETVTAKGRTTTEFRRLDVVES
jgi:hypothetical protein